MPKDLNRLEQSNIDRAARLVVRIRRDIERNEKEQDQLNAQHEEEEARYKARIKDLGDAWDQLKADLEEAEEYLKALTIERSK